MNSDRALAVFENYKIRRVYDEASETWYFSVVDIVASLIQQPDYQAARNYWKVLKNRLKKEGSQTVTDCNLLKMVAEDGKMRFTDAASPETILTNIIHREGSEVSVKKHKTLKGLKTQNLRDHMSEAELIFTALAELSTRQIAETVQATGMPENAEAGRKGGGIAKRARRELEQKTGRSVVTGENFLPPSATGKKIENRT
jgi:DNA-damage-inducible protein D